MFGDVIQFDCLHLSTPPSWSLQRREVQEEDVMKLTNLHQLSQQHIHLVPVTPLGQPNISKIRGMQNWFKEFTFSSFWNSFNPSRNTKRTCVLLHFKKIIPFLFWNWQECWCGGPCTLYQLNPTIVLASLHHSSLSVIDHCKIYFPFSSSLGKTSPRLLRCFI